MTERCFYLIDETKETHPVREFRVSCPLPTDHARFHLCFDVHHSVTPQVVPDPAPLRKHLVFLRRSNKRKAPQEAAVTLSCTGEGVSKCL